MWKATACCRDHKSPEEMRYRDLYTQKVSEEHAQNDGCKQRCDYFLDGSDYLEAVVDGIIKHGDVVFMMSVDGAQLMRARCRTSGLEFGLCSTVRLR